MSVIGKKPLQDEREFSQNLPPITKLAITSVSSGFDGTTGWIVVSTTQTVDDKQVGDYVKITPEKKLTFTVNENQFRIEGDFSDVQTAHLKISKGLPGLYGGQLEFDYEQDVVLVNINPSINFTDKAGIYMMLSGQKNLEVNAVNETGAEVEVLQVFKNNLLYFLNSNSYRFRRYNYDDEDYYYDDYYNSNGEFYVSDYGKEIYSEKINLSNKKNWLQKFTINLSKALNQQRKGVFVVNVHATNDRWERDSKMVAISDLGIICKKSEDELMVFVNSIATAEPVKDVQINIISTNNQTILSGKTDDDGIIKFTGVKAKIEGFYPRLITAEKDNDFNYLDLRNTEIETSRFDVGGIYQYSENYNTFIYSERNLYRTGDKINLVGIVRNDKIKIVKDIPIIVKVIAPTGKVFDEFKKTLNDEGSFRAFI